MASVRASIASRQAAAVRRGAAVSCRATHQRNTNSVVQRRQLFSLLAGTAGLLALGERAEAVPTVEEMLERSTANKELNDKKRAATSGANLARSRTVTDVCSRMEYTSLTRSDMNGRRLSENDSC